MYLNMQHVIGWITFTFSDKKLQRFKNVIMPSTHGLIPSYCRIATFSPYGKKSWMWLLADALKFIIQRSFTMVPASPTLVDLEDKLPTISFPPASLLMIRIPITIPFLALLLASLLPFITPHFFPTLCVAISPMHCLPLSTSQFCSPHPFIFLHSLYCCLLNSFPSHFCVSFPLPIPRVKS